MKWIFWKNLFFALLRMINPNCTGLFWASCDWGGGGGGEVSKYFKEKSHETAQFKAVEITQQNLLGGGGL